MKAPYVAPRVEVVGSLEELTLRSKAVANPFDGDRLNGKPLTTISGGP